MVVTELLYFSEYHFILRLKSGEFSMCPQCKKKTNVNCKGCKKNLGHGNEETSCSCSLSYDYEKAEKEESMNKGVKPATKALGDNRHANELEEELIKNKGLCNYCLLPHPGYCAICQRLLSLPSNGQQLPKVFTTCCDRYFHFECW